MLWDQGGYEIEYGTSPFSKEVWTDERIAELFDVLDAMLLAPRARLIVGSEFVDGEWDGWYYDSAVGDLVDLYDSPNEVVAERSIAIARLAAQMHGGEAGIEAVDRWLKNERASEGEMFPVDEFFP